MKRYEWVGCVGAQETKPKLNTNILLFPSSSSSTTMHSRFTASQSSHICQFMCIFFFGFCVLSDIQFLSLSLFFFQNAHYLCSVSYLNWDCFIDFVARCWRKSGAVFCVWLWMSPHWDKNTRKIPLFSTASIYFVCFTLFHFK